jgi:F-type H+-transporting ATPase subunit delta
MQEIAARRYSVALFEAGKEQNRIDAYLEQIKGVSEALLEHKDFMKLLTHPNIDKKEKKNIIQETFKDRVEEEVIKLLFLLIDHERINEIKHVYEDYKLLVYEYKGIKVAYVTTAVKMTDEEMIALREKLDKKYNVHTIIENTVDPSVIGGVYLRIGDEVIDGTIRGSLEKMRKDILKQGSEVRS